jgi:K+/H+ antiporter YhaU regulatory subunit KhtT
MVTRVTLRKEEYEMLRTKAELFDHLVETDEITDEELAKVKKALRGPFLKKTEFLKKHPELT